MNTVLTTEQVSLLHNIESSDHSISNHPSPPPPPTWFVLRGLPSQVCVKQAHTHWAGFRTTSFGLRHSLAGSPRRQAESSSLTYGLVVHFQLLSTSSHENAVTFSYKV